MAPEIVARKYYLGKPADIWACGVCLYYMLFGKYPFCSQDNKQLFKLI